MARGLRVSTKSAYTWRRAWKTGGVQALISQGPGGSACQLDHHQLEQLQAELDRGPAAHGWTDDQRWTLTRVTTLIKRLFGVDYTPRGVSYLLHRLDWSPQVPVHRAAERDEAAITTWRRQVWPQIKAPRRPRTPGSASKTRQAKV